MSNDLLNEEVDTLTNQATTAGLILDTCFNDFDFIFFQKPHRLLPTNLYVVLYNFKPRHSDELELK